MAKASKRGGFRASKYELVNIRNPASRLSISLNARKPEKVLAGALDYLGWRVTKSIPAE